MDNPEKTEEAVNNGQSREIDNTGHTRRRQTKHKKYNTICVGHTMRKQTQITQIRHDPFHKQMETNTDRTPL